MQESLATVTALLLLRSHAEHLPCSRSDRRGRRAGDGADGATAVAAGATVEALEAAVAENPLKDAYFGETHVHTSYSLDAYIGGARITPDEAYKFAQGADVVVNGQKHNIGRPLDWVAVSDHAEYIGEMYSTQVPGAKGGDNPMLEELRNLKSVDQQREWFLKYVVNNNRGDNPTHPPFYAGPETTRSAWKDIEVKAAIDNYRPGKFTTLVGYEWTSAPKGGNMHRNVIFRDLNVPDMPLTRARHQRRGKALGVDGGAGKERLAAAGDPAQLERQQGPDVRAHRQFRQADHGGLRAPAQPLRAPDRDDADQGQFGGSPELLAGRRVCELRERRQRRVVQRAHVQEGVLRALGRDQGPRLPDRSWARTPTSTASSAAPTTTTACRRTSPKTTTSAATAQRTARSRRVAMARSTAGSSRRSRTRARWPPSGRRGTRAARSGTRWPRAKLSSLPVRASR